MTLVTNVDYDVASVWVSSTWMCSLSLISLSCILLFFWKSTHSLLDSEELSGLGAGMVSAPHKGALKATAGSDVEIFKQTLHVWFLSLPLTITDLKGGNAHFYLPTFCFPSVSNPCAPDLHPYQVTLSSVSTLCGLCGNCRFGQRGQPARRRVHQVGSMHKKVAKLLVFDQQERNTPHMRGTFSVPHPMHLHPVHSQWQPSSSVYRRNWVWGRPHVCPHVSSNTGTLKANTDTASPMVPILSRHLMYIKAFNLHNNLSR